MNERREPFDSVLYYEMYAYLLTDLENSLRAVSSLSDIWSQEFNHPV